MQSQQLVNMYPRESDILQGDPAHLIPPRLLNPLLAREVVLSTGEKIIIEQSCSTCEFGSLELDVEPCKTCNGMSHAENLYPKWIFDRNYDPEQGNEDID